MTERDDDACAAVRFAPGAEGPARCSGALAELAVADVVQLLQLIGKSAVMTVTVAHHGERSRLWCAEGSMIDAESGRLRGEAAAYRILSLDDGWLEAELRHEERPRTIYAPTQRLLLEAARRTDELQALLRKLGGARCCYRLVHEPEPEQLTSPGAAELRLLQLLSTTASVAELLAESELGDLETLIALERWCEAGQLAQVGQRPEGPTPSPASPSPASPSPASPSPASPSPSALASSASAPSVPPLAASVPPPAARVPPLARSTAPDRRRLAALAAGAALLAAASFVTGYLLRDGAALAIPHTAASGSPADEPLASPARATEPPAAAAAEGASPADGALAAARPMEGALTAPATSLELAPPELDDPAREPEMAGRVATTQQALLPASEVARTSRTANAGRPTPLEHRRTRASAPAARSSPVISEPRVRVIGATEPSIRVLD